MNLGELIVAFWKGGEYEMHEFTTVHLAYRGDVGEELSSMQLAYMLGQPIPVPCPFCRGEGQC